MIGCLTETTTYYVGWTRLRPKLSGVSKKEGNGVVTKKGVHVWGKSRVREGLKLFTKTIICSDSSDKLCQQLEI